MSGREDDLGSVQHSGIGKTGMVLIIVAGALLWLAQIGFGVYLAWSEDQQRAEFACADAVYTDTWRAPPALFVDATQCAAAGDMAKSIVLYSAARALVYFDALRVPGTTRSVMTGIGPQIFAQSLSADQHSDLLAARRMAIESEEVWGMLCEWLDEMGPPAYHPDYLVAITGRPALPAEAFDADAAWARTLSAFVRCGLNV